MLQPDELTLIVDNTIEEKKLNNCKNVESDHKNCNLRMVNNNLKKSWQQRAAAASGGSGRLHRGNLLTEENCAKKCIVADESASLTSSQNDGQLMASPWFQEGLSR